MQLLTNLALGGAATQQSTYSSAAPASKAVDGNTDGNWSSGSVTHTNEVAETWWQVDLGQLSYIESMNIFNRTDCCGGRLSGFYVLVSDTPFVGSSLAEARAEADAEYVYSGTVSVSDTIAVGSNGRYVRIQLYSDGIAQNILSLAEVQIMGWLADPTITSLNEAVSNNHERDIAPVFDFDGDGCLPATGISRTGQQNPGLNPSGSLGGGCRNSEFLKHSNTMHRSQCTIQNGTEYCGHIYAMYFQKDQAISGVDAFGHRHDWEHVAIWTTNGVITHGSVSAHGSMNTNAINNIPKDGNHIRVVYHKDGPSTHAFRFADWSEAAENPYGAFVTPTIASWFYMSGDGISNAEMRSLLNGFDYGSGNLPVKDSNFLNNMNNFKPAGYPHFFPEGQDCEFTNWFSEEGSATAMCGDDRVVTGIECSGRYCDSKRLKCCNVANVVPFGSSWENNSSISEESPNSYSNDNAVMVGLKCSGSYCDNLTPIMRNNSAGQSGSWVPYFSEEQGLGECPAGSYVAGIACSGSYCDSLSLYCQQQ